MSVTRPFACGVWTRHCVLSLQFTPRRLIRRGDCVNFHWLIQTATVSASACPKDNGRKQDNALIEPSVNVYNQIGTRNELRCRNSWLSAIRKFDGWECPIDA